MGKEIALEYAREGATVLALARRKERLEELAVEAEGAPGKIVPFAADISKNAAIDEVFSYIQQNYGKLDITVNNAGILDNMVPVGDVTDDLWDKIINLNLTALMRITRESVKMMLAQKGGVILNIASVGGLYGCRGGAAYVASKHAVVGLTKNTGYMYAQEGIRCNVICPGAVDTEIGTSEGSSDRNMFGARRVGSGMGTNPRAGDSDEIAKVALFLASDDASFINGASITVDGGWSAY
jgi:NAD(P)-dependent dehydrogenase (short-subunit alcohol dehydrogenase family)